MIVPLFSFSFFPSLSSPEGKETSFLFLSPTSFSKGEKRKLKLKWKKKYGVYIHINVIKRW